MPYDPDWDLEGEEGAGAGADAPGSAAEYRSSSLGGESDGLRGEEMDEGKEGEEDFDEADDMETDTLRIARHHSAVRDTDATPRSSLPFPGAGRVSRSHVEVVLHSSPSKTTTTQADELAEVYDDESNLVASDIVTKPMNPSGPAAKAQVVPSKPQPRVAPTAASTVTPQPKKRGRPVGWRLGHGSYSAMRSGLPPGQATPRPKPKKPTGDQAPRRRGRKPAPTARQIYLKLNPQFIAFRCEWENCPAELQNLETLRKHLVVVHTRPPPLLPPPATQSTSTPTKPQPPPPLPSRSPPFPCKWSTCTAPPLPSLSAFTAHIETAHLLPHLWHAGDGPRNTVPSPSTFTSTSPDSRPSSEPRPPNPNANHKLPAYLLDPLTGRQVTPSVATQEMENEDDRRRRQARINRVLALRDRHAPNEVEYTAREMGMIARVLAERRARQKMFGEYKERVEREAGLEGWRV